MSTIECVTCGRKFSMPGSREQAEAALLTGSAEDRFARVDGGLSCTICVATVRAKEQAEENARRKDEQAKEKARRQQEELRRMEDTARLKASQPRPKRSMPAAVPRKSSPSVRFVPEPIGYNPSPPAPPPADGCAKIIFVQDD